MSVDSSGRCSRCGLMVPPDVQHFCAPVIGPGQTWMLPTMPLLGVAAGGGPIVSAPVCWHDWESVPPETVGGGPDLPINPWTYCCKRCGKRGTVVALIQAEGEGVCKLP